jgi:hypothetical protein
LNIIFDKIDVAFNQTSKVCRWGVGGEVHIKIFFFFRNFFLDWDGLGFMSALEQNFNPSVEDIKRRTALGKWNTLF